MTEAAANEKVHYFNTFVYATPFLGALLADAFFGKYRIIVWLSIVYCMGHATLAFMGEVGDAKWLLFAGLALISLGAGGIKPCVSAHVGDQFGKSNSHHLPRIFNIFYFSINLGAFISMLLTPWLLKWYGPHLAFGIPGVLMALATFVFWLGRKRFVHVPAGGMEFVRETFSPHGLRSLVKLIPLVSLIAMFWSLFDQTGSSWIFQALDMDRNLFGQEWLPSQIQSINSLFVLTFIPIFTFILYPRISRVWNLTPLRKISIGLFLMTAAFSLTSLIQTLDRERRAPFDYLASARLRPSHGSRSHGLHRRTGVCLHPGTKTHEVDDHVLLPLFGSLRQLLHRTGQPLHSDPKYRGHRRSASRPRWHTRHCG